LRYRRWNRKEWAWVYNKGFNVKDSVFHRFWWGFDVDPQGGLQSTCSKEDSPKVNLKRCSKRTTVNLLEWALSQCSGGEAPGES